MTILLAEDAMSFPPPLPGKRTTGLSKSPIYVVFMFPYSFILASQEGPAREGGDELRLSLNRSQT